MTAILKQRVEAMWTSGVAGQLVRFGIAGAITSAIYTAIYLPLTIWVFARAHAVFAVPFAFAAAVTAGFFLHSNWSFRGYGTRTGGSGQRVGFVAVQAFGLGLHGAFTWVLTGPLGQPVWTPLIPGFIVVPLVTFALNRQWVFR